MLCKCGCGLPTPIAERTSSEKGWIRGTPKQYIHGHNRRKARHTPLDKQCSLCGQVKDISEYYEDKRKTDGYSSRCKECVKSQSQKQYEQDPDVAYRAARARIAKDPERHRDYKRDWYHRDLAHSRMLSLRKQAVRMKLLASQLIEEIDRLLVYERDHGICGLCGAALSRDNFHVDHIVPLSKGGLHAYSNVQVACPACNLHKSNRLL